MHQAKQRGKRQYQFYTAATTRTAARQPGGWRADCERRCPSGSFSGWPSSPVVRLDGELSGFEVLLRLPPAGPAGCGDTQGESVTTTS